MSYFQTAVLWVAFLVLSVPLTSYAEVINRVESGADQNQSITLTAPDGKTNINASISTSLVATDLPKATVQDSTTEAKGEQTQSKGIVTSDSGLRISQAGITAVAAPGEATEAPDDISNVRGAGAPASQSGAFEYSYTVDVPPGRNGLTPDVTLQYSSNATNLTSPFGYGWAMHVPKIERVNLTGSHKLYSENNFTSSLDGELVAVSSTTYRAQVELGSFNTYTYIDGVWTVYDKVGTRYTFGSTTASRQDNASNTAQVAAWMLDEILDTNGEKVTYTYFKNSGQIYPDTISYAYNAGVPFYMIKFFRSSLTSSSLNLAHSQFSKGFEEKANYVVSSIQVFTNAVKTSQVSLTYIYESWSTSLLLSEFTRTGYSESGVATVLPKTTFTYKLDAPYSFTNNATWASSTPGNLFTILTEPSPSSSSMVRVTEAFYRTKIIDMNGDGLADWVSGGNVYMNTGAGWTATATWSGLPINFDASYRLVDINGDSLPDKIRAKEYTFHASLGLSNYKEVEFLFNQGDGTWRTDPAWSTTTPLLFYSENTLSTGSKYFATYRSYFADMNGDGLTDWVYAGNVYMNTGTGFTQTPTWSGLPSNFETQDRLEDINGDSLPDIVRAYKKTFDPSYSTSPAITDYSVKLNRGDGTWQTDAYWTASIPSPIYIEHQVSASVTHATSTNVYFADMNGDSLSEWLVGERVYKNTGTRWSSAFNTVSIKTNNFSKDVRLTDVNGDALPDYVVASTKSWDASFNQPTVVFRALFLNNAKKIWLLSNTTNEQGGTTDIAYTPSTFPKKGVLQNSNSPYPLYTVSSVTVNPKIGLKQTTTYEYAGGDLYHNPANIFTRKYAGFGTVTQTNSLGKVKTYYHQGNGNAAASRETGDDYGKIGQSYRTEVFNTKNKVFQTSLRLFATSSVAQGSLYTKLQQSTQLDYDGNSDHRDSAVSYTYDNANGNVLTESQWGEVRATQTGTFTDTGTDKRTTVYTYASSTTAHSVGLPATERLLNRVNTKIKESRYYYDDLPLGLVDKGNLTRTEAWATSSSYSATESAYNAYGLKVQDKDPRGGVTTYSYDAYNLYPATITNALSQSTAYTYDYTSGKVKTAVDGNGFTHSTLYDGFDRVLEVKEPRGANGAAVTVVKNTYTDTAGAVSVQSRKYLDDTYSVDTYAYFDGLGRPIQTRQEAEKANQYSVRDTVYGTDGNVAKESVPYFGTGTNRTAASTKNNLYTKYAYDALNRKVNVATVVGTTTIGFDQWQQTVTDALGIPKKSTYDAFGNLVNVIEQNDTSSYTTSYEWTPHGGLTKVTDALGNVRTMQYDGLARRLSAQDLHAPTDTTFGTWTFAYDAAGNTATATDPSGRVIVTTYDALNRPLSENHLGQAGIESSYVYDTCTNGKGYLCTSTSGSTVTTRKYNPAGLIASEQKTIGGTAYTHSYQYDRQNNQTAITYPDASDVSYTFNTAGLLEKVEQREKGGSYRTIIANYNYGPLGQVVYQLHGNGASTTKTYDENELYRLRSIVTTATNPTGSGGEALGMLEEGLFSSSTEVAAMVSAELPLVVAPSEDVLISSPEATSSMREVIVEVAPATSIASSTLIASTSAATTSDLVRIDQVVEKPAAVFVNTHFVPKNISRDTPTETATTLQFVSTEDDFQNHTLVELNKYIPEARFKKWDGEVDFGISPLSVRGAAVYSREKNITQWTDASSTLMVEAYPLKPVYGMEDGGFELEVVVQEKPQSNLFRFAIDGYQNLDFFYQAALNAETHIDPAISECTETTCVNKAGEILLSRPENVIGSYAVYHKGSQSDVPAYDFAAGKVGHIYRPKVVDALGQEVWATMSYKEGILTIDVPPDFLAEATYPVRVDPTFGYGVVGGSGVVGTSGDTIRGGSVLATEPGLVDSVSVYVSGLTANMKSLITDSSLNLLPNGVTNPIAISSTTGAWYTMSYATSARPAVTGAGTYYLGMITSTTSPSFVYRFDSVPEYSRILDGTNNYATPTNPTDATITTGRRVSMYATYSPTTAPLTIPTALYTEGTTSPKSVIDTTPEFSAIYNAASPGSVATSYQIQVATNATFKVPYWDSGKESLATTTLSGNRTPDISYGGAALAPGTTYYWRIQLWDAVNVTSGWSTTSSTFRLVAAPLATSSGFVPVIQNLTYVYDRVGNIIQVVDISGTNGAGTTTYTYDTLYRLTSASTSNALAAPYREDYAYNAIGNITYKTGIGSYLYAGAVGNSYANPHAPTSIDSAAHTYDKNGNLLSSANLQNTWDYRNRLLSTRAGTTTTTYTYDTNEQRVQKTVAGITTRYPSPYFETTAASTSKHIYAGGALVASVSGTGSTTARLYHTHQDHLGSTGAQTNDIGYLTHLSSYYPFGAQRLDEETANPSSSAFREPNQFIGQDYDQEPALSYLNARYYDGKRGQFLSQDPVFWEIGQTRDGVTVLQNPQAQNSYSYAQNSPIVQKDPSGRCPVCGLMLIGAVANMAAQGLEDLSAGNSFQWQNYAGAAVAGGVGAVTLLLNPVGGAMTVGAVTSGTEDLTTQLLTNGTDINFRQVARESAGGAFFSQASKYLRVPAVTSGRNSLQVVTNSTFTKVSNGTINNFSKKTGAKVLATQIIGNTPQSLYNGGSDNKKIQKTINNLYGQILSLLQKQVSALKEKIGK